MNTQIRQTSTLAVVSLVFGLLAWTFVPILGAIVAIITGHLARGEIRRDPERMEGDGLALAGLILGYLSLLMAVIVIMALIFVFGLIAWFA